MAPLGATSTRDNRVLCIFFKTVYFCFKKWYERVQTAMGRIDCALVLDFCYFPEEGRDGRNFLFPTNVRVLVISIIS